MHIKKMVNSLKNLFLTGALLLLLTFNASNTFADFYVIAGSKGVGTKINALPYTISSSGFYFIAKDLSCAAGSPGITITADNVTLDLMGFSLVGPGSGNSYSGIYMYQRANVEIRNGTVRNFVGSGIREGNSSGKGHRIINIRVMDNQLCGIKLYGESHLVEKCIAVSNGDIGIHAGAASTVTGNTCKGNTSFGIYASIGSAVTGNTCKGNSFGIGGDDFGGFTVTGNTCYLNTHDGIVAGAGSTVTGNTCFNNSQRGIYTFSGSTVAGNTCNENGNNGIYTFGTGFTVTGNTCFHNGHHGIYADVGSTVIGNTCCNNTSQYGIYLNGNNFVDQNTAYGNGTNMNTTCATCTFGLNHAP